MFEARSRAAMAAVLGACMLLPLCLDITPEVPAVRAPFAAPPAVAFGTDPHELDWLAERDVHPQYVQVWVGAWLTRAGWDAVDQQLAAAKDHNVTPVIQFYYWADEFSAACFARGCETSDGIRKDQVGWHVLAIDLAHHLDGVLAGHRAVIVLETEFNKAMRSDEAWDDALAAQARFLKGAYPEARVALGFGNWDRASWPNFNRAVAASDEVSLQTLRASTRHDLASYRGAARDLVEGAKELQRLFGKPIIVSDLGLSTYGGAAFVQAQADVLREVHASGAELAEAGVYAIVYRSVRDAQGAPLGHFGKAERHFGLVWSRNGTAKPGFYAWQEGVAAFAVTGAAPQVSVLDASIGFTGTEGVRPASGAGGQEA